MPGDFLSGADALTTMQFALGGILVAVMLLVIALYTDRSRSNRLTRALVTEIDRVAEGTDPNPALLPRDRRLATIVASLETKPEK